MLANKYYINHIKKGLLWSDGWVLERFQGTNSGCNRILGAWRGEGSREILGHLPVPEGALRELEGVAL